MTIKQLAEKTGYAIGTVSRALNNHPNVSPKAREAILKAAAEAGFEPNINAKQLKQQRSNIILVIVKGTANQLFSALVEALQQRIDQTSHPMVVDYLDEDANEVVRAIQLCAEKKPLGVLFLGATREHLLADFGKIHVPAVLITGNAEGLPFPNLNSVSSDDAAAAAAAIETLIALGHRNFAVLGGDRVQSNIADLRFRGCMEAFQAHGIHFQPELDYESIRFSYADGYQATCRLLEKKRLFTAMFAMSDVMAMGAIRALHEHGLRVPGDVSIMGFDGLEFGRYAIPQLSSVSQNVEELAKRSVQILLENIASPQPPRHELLGITVHSRESISRV